MVRKPDEPLLATFCLQCVVLFAFACVEAAFENAGFRPFAFAETWPYWLQYAAAGGAAFVFMVSGLPAACWLSRRFGQRNTERCMCALAATLLFGAAFLFQHNMGITWTNSLTAIGSLAIIVMQTLTPEFTVSAYVDRIGSWLDQIVARSYFARRWPRFFAAKHEAE